MLIDIDKLLLLQETHNFCIFHNLLNTIRMSLCDREDIV
jgi:hypothetical protein